MTKAIACELPRRTKQPVSRLYVPDIRAELMERGIVESMIETFVYRLSSGSAERR